MAVPTPKKTLEPTSMSYRKVFADFADTSFLRAIIERDAGAKLWC
jgi:hypothetical protein